MHAVQIGNKWAVIKLSSVGSHYEIWHFGLKEWLWTFYSTCLTDEATAKNFVDENNPKP